ncbi:MAG TPA: ELWxxDGT repeat protein, partial [Thermoanaerobaculia bacterium]|nr:ELWxxDGT repeat protein [Thermoanaerobaculia bacterium]
QCGLWRTDGTTAGTVRLNELSSGSVSELTLGGSRLFFTSDNQEQLWTSDGTPAGTTLVRQFTNGSPRHLAALGNKVLFLAPAIAPGSGEELWVSDGTAAGTIALTSFEAESPFQQTRFLKTLGNRVYFVADDVTHGAEIYASDGTAAGTVRVTDFGFFNPFGWESDFEEGGLAPSQIAKLGNRLVFWATDGLHQYQPWSNLGTFASTAPLCSGCAFEQNGIFQPLNSGLVFVAAASSEDFELWGSDGTPQGTRKLGNTCSECGNDLALAAGAVYFRGPVPDGTTALDSTLWVSDGTAAGTRLFAAAEAQTFDAPFSVAALGGRILFGAWSGLAGDFRHNDVELWSSDGSPGGTRQTADINRAGNSSNVRSSVAAGGDVFSIASENGEDNLNVWRSDGTEPGTVKLLPSFFDFRGTSQLAVGGDKAFLVTDDFSSSGSQLWRVQHEGPNQQLLSGGQSQFIASPVSYRGQLYFLRGQGELWTSDGSAQGTRKAIEIPGIPSPSFLEAPGSELWFLAHDPDSFEFSQVWRTDGTQAGTRRVHDFGFNFAGFDPEFTQIGSQVYFIALQPNFDIPQVWKTDGSDAGTSAITSPTAQALPAELTSFQGNLYFFANQTPGGPRALWRSDGTPGGTTVVHSFPAEPDSSIFEPPHAGLTVLGSRLVFAIDDGVHGREPWTSDGTPGGTALLRDVLPGPAGSGATSFTAAAGQLFFAAHDGAHGFEPWRTDGTPDGTRLVQDIAPEGASSYPADFTLAGDKLFFSANDGISGTELWALPLSGSGCQPSATTLCLNAGRFAVAAHWKTTGGNEGAGTAVPLSADTGYFWFFGPANVEAILKVLDGRSLNDAFWVFYGALSNVEYTLTVTDTQTGLARRYLNPQGQFASVGDTAGFGPLGAYDRKSIAAPSPPPLIAERIDLAAATGTCVPASGRLCLNNGRFAVEAVWKDFSNHTGTGTAVGLTGDTGYFWFFDPANVEAVLKVLDATTVNGHFWVYYGALSNVEYTLTVTDTMTGKVKTYQNPLGRFASAGDTVAF